MKLIRIYHAAIVVSAMLYLMYMFAPWVYQFLNPEIQSLLSYGGAGAYIDFPEWLFWGHLFGNLAGYIGMAFFRKAFRVLFLIVTIGSLLVSPLYGISIITGIEVFLVDASTLLSGLVIALAYFTTLNERFY